LLFLLLLFLLLMLLLWLRRPLDLLLLVLLQLLWLGLLLPMVLLLLLLQLWLLWLPRDRSWSLRRGCLGGTRTPSLWLGHLAGVWSPSLRRGHLGRMGLLVRTGSASLGRGHLRRDLPPSLGLGACRCTTMEASLPPTALAGMIPVIEILVIMLTIMVAAPIGVSLRKSLDILRMLLIPGIPPCLIPVSRSDNIGGRISIIWRPAILIAVKIIQQAI
jgi:hypothetical protein